MLMRGAEFAFFVLLSHFFHAKNHGNRANGKNGKRSYAQNCGTGTSYSPFPDDKKRRENPPDLIGWKDS